MRHAILLSILVICSSRSLCAQPITHGKASWYGYEWTTGKRGVMANGRKFNPQAFSAASYEYPLGSVLLVTNNANGKQVAVMVTDRGPARRLGRLLDLSESAATALDYHEAGITTVDVKVLVPKS
jgi:rare lipoprotein A